MSGGFPVLSRYWFIVWFCYHPKHFAWFQFFDVIWGLFSWLKIWFDVPRAFENDVYSAAVGWTELAGTAFTCRFSARDTTRGALKPPATTVGFSVSLFSSVGLCFTWFESSVVRNMDIRYCYASSVNWLLAHRVMAIFIRSNITGLKFTLCDINTHTLIFFRLVLALCIIFSILLSDLPSYFKWVSFRQHI